MPPRGARNWTESDYIVDLRERVRRLELGRPTATEFTPLVPNEGFDASDVDCGYYLTNGFVVFTGGLYWGFPDGYSFTGADEYDPANDASNLFSTTDAFGGTTYAGHLLPEEIRPVEPDLYIDCHAIEVDHGLSGLIRYETRVNPAGAWSISRAFSGGGTSYPVDDQGRSHIDGVPYNQFIMLEGVTWRVEDL